MRAVENALGITIPDNARLIRNLLEGIQFVHDHVMHFYHLHALDWVDVVSALGADPAATGTLARSLSDWPNSSTAYFTAVRDRLSVFASSGQLGLFNNGYWGNPAYRLTPEANLLALAHYLEALDWQREVIKIHALLGGKNPHPQTYLVGGMAIPMHPESPVAINSGRIAQLHALAARSLDFVRRVYYPDVRYIASRYPEWATLGRGVGNHLSYGDLPLDNSGNLSALFLPQGIVYGNNLDVPPAPVDQLKVREYVARSWYAYTGGDGASLHPWQGQTQPNYTGPQAAFTTLPTNGKYSWLKAPRYDGQVMEVGPLSRMSVAYAAGNPRVRQGVDSFLADLGLPRVALFSTLGRIGARAIETLVLAEALDSWVGQLEANLNSGNWTIHDKSRWEPSTWPAQAQGWGITEAPRGALGHWVTINAGVIDTYQAVVASTWNGSPRDAAGQRGAWEEALIGTPVPDLTQPVEILRTIHSFDPCMACAVHVMDATGQEVTRVQVVE